MSGEEALGQLQLGRHQLQAGNWSGAERAARGALAVAPGLQPAHTVLSLALLRQGKAQAALHAAEDALAIAPSWDAFQAKGLALKELHRFREAQQAIADGLGVAPDSPWLQAIAGDILEARGKLGEAETAYRHAMELAPGETNIHARFGLFLLRHRRLAEAEQVAATIAPEDTDLNALVLRGHIALRRGRTGEARDYALWALSISAMNGAALGLLVSVKASKSLVLGLWWRYVTFLTMQRGWRKYLTTLAIIAIAFTLALLSGGSVALLYLWPAYVLLSRSTFQRMLRRELKTVKLRRSF